MFYCSTILTHPVLDETESQHAIKVLRLVEGEKIKIADGNGKIYLATITNAHFKKCAFEIEQTIEEQTTPRPHIHIAIAPTKSNDRIEWMLEKAIEVGLSELSFLVCKHSERKEINLERFYKVAISAMKQSGRAFLPKLNPIVSFDKFVNTTYESEKFIAHVPQHGTSPNLINATKGSGKYLVMIGPEGDFSQSELKLAKDKLYTPISLGNFVLRTETAGLIACHSLNLLNLINS